MVTVILKEYIIVQGMLGPLAFDSRCVNSPLLGIINTNLLYAL